MNDQTTIRNEWIRRCSARLQTRGGMTENDAQQCAEACLDNVDGDLTENPEDCADEEMSCWGE